MARVFVGFVGHYRNICMGYWGKSYSFQAGFLHKEIKYKHCMVNSLEQNPFWPARSRWGASRSSHLQRTGSFIIVFTEDRHWHLSGAKWIQSTSSHSISSMSALIFYSHLCLVLVIGLSFEVFRLRVVLRKCVVSDIKICKLLRVLNCWKVFIDLDVECNRNSFCCVEDEVYRLTDTAFEL